jgi:hypothetical protein
LMIADLRFSLEGLLDSPLLNRVGNCQSAIRIPKSEIADA